MKRPKLHLYNAKVNKNDLPDFDDIFFEDFNQPARGQREKLRRWRRLKHQIA